MICIRINGLDNTWSATPNFSKSYIEQTKRNMETTFKEHTLHLKNHYFDRLALALCYRDTGDKLDIKNLKLLKNSYEKKLDMLEAIQMRKYKNNLQ